MDNLLLKSDEVLASVPGDARIRGAHAVGRHGERKVDGPRVAIEPRDPNRLVAAFIPRNQRRIAAAGDVEIEATRRLGDRNAIAVENLSAWSHASDPENGEVVRRSDPPDEVIRAVEDHAWIFACCCHEDSATIERLTVQRDARDVRP